MHQLDHVNNIVIYFLMDFRSFNSGRFNDELRMSFQMFPVELKHQDLSNILECIKLTCTIK